MSKVGLILASDKVLDAVMKVKWEGKIAPLVVHQARVFERYVDNIYIAVGENADRVIDVLDGYGVDYKFFYDKKQEGKAMVWRQFINKFGKKDFISVDVNSLHSTDDWRSMCEMMQSGNWISVTYTENSELVKSYCLYDVFGERVVNVVGRESGRGEGYIGTGVYALKADGFARTVMIKTGEMYVPEPMIQQMILDGEYFRIFSVNVWCDVSKEENLARVMVK